MEFRKFNFQINAFDLTINFIGHFYEYSLSLFLIQSVIYPNIDPPYLFTEHFFTFNTINNFVVLLQTSLTLFHCVLLEIHSHSSLYVRVRFPILHEK